MSPELLDPNRKRPERSRAARRSPDVPAGREALFDRAVETVLGLPAVLDRFVDKKPVVVMFRIASDWILQGTPFDKLFEETAEGQYTREFTLEHLALVMLDVVCGHHPSVRSAFVDRQLDLIASLTAFYGKLNRREPGITRELVVRTSRRARELIVAAGGLLAEPIPGYAARILDGNVLAGSEHRLKPTRTTWSACLPGKSLAVYEPASGLIIDLVLEENAHTQERAILDQVGIAPGELWIVDRNFCVRTFLFRIDRSGAFFLAREHRTSLPFEPVTPLTSKGRCATGEVFEQEILVDAPELPGVRHRLRRIVLRLDRPTRDGEVEIALVTNLPADVTAVVCCETYRGRWSIEGHFQILTELLHCEIPSLGYPRAALFAFGMSATAGNALAVLKGSLRAAHGPELAAAVSDAAVTVQVAQIYPGMMIAAPPSVWPELAARPAWEVSAMLVDLAARVQVERMRRSPRGPKKPKKARSKGDGGHHLATKKLLDEAKGVRPPKRREAQTV
jgi:hypothetical protein